MKADLLLDLGREARTSPTSTFRTGLRIVVQPTRGRLRGGARTRPAQGAGRRPCARWSEACCRRPRGVVRREDDGSASVPRLLDGLGGMRSSRPRRRRAVRVDGDTVIEVEQWTSGERITPAPHSASTGALASGGGGGRLWLRGLASRQLYIGCHRLGVLGRRRSSRRPNRQGRRGPPRHHRSPTTSSAVGRRVGTETNYRGHPRVSYRRQRRPKVAEGAGGLVRCSVQHPRQGSASGSNPQVVRRARAGPHRRPRRRTLPMAVHLVAQRRISRTTARAADVTGIR